MLKQLWCLLSGGHRHYFIDDYKIDFIGTKIRLVVTTYCSKCTKTYFEKIYIREPNGNIRLTNTDYKYGFIKHVANNRDDLKFPEKRFFYD